MPMIDGTRCPLCQEINLCGVNGKQPCWCVSRNVSGELLQKVPTELAGKSCVCQQCIDKFDHEKQVKNLSNNKEIKAV